jgi:hypothetical protein
MPGDPRRGSKVWEAPDREIGKPGETYQGIARVSKEKCRSIDRQALCKRHVEAPDTLWVSLKGLALGLTMLVSFYR